jgi:hypothetical protein
VASKKRGKTALFSVVAMAPDGAESMAPLSIFVRPMER